MKPNARLMRFIASFCMIVFFVSCSSSKQSKSTYANPAGTTLKITGISADESYGYTEANPVKVGGQVENGAASERRYLNSLTGPNGEELEFRRLGSCCHFKTPNGIMGTGLLDKYEVTYPGLSKPIILYLNMYDNGELKAPKGFRFKE